MRLADWMDMTRITDEQLAERIGVHRSAVGRYRLGQRLPRPDAMMRIKNATAGKVTPADFYGLPAEKHHTPQPAASAAGAVS